MHTVKAIYPGTFDPLTNGHLDLIARGSKIVDHLVVAILRNSEKGTPLFTVPERVEMLTEATRSFGNVSVATFNGLLVDFARAQNARAVLRGIRAISDYEYELQMAMMNRKLDPELETLFMMPAEKYTYVSSRLVKGVFQLGGDVSSLVPQLVMERLKARIPAAQEAR
ncbi:MAG: pantetheine-phosphate adenylyltransferase [Acidobacteriota bacterium]|nr:pantetheine-phosphate adenylyltransferase [Acidobacteriota bacterium]